MLPSVSVSSNSSDRRAALTIAGRAIMASWLARLRERYAHAGFAGSLLIWVVFPPFTLLTAGLIYHGHRPDLLRYAVIGVTAGTFISSTLYNLGQILDEERMNGTLISLFLAPCPRLSWLTGLTLGSLVETFIAAGVTIATGVVVFGVRFDPDVPALLLSFGLFLLSLWGLGLAFSAIGLILKKSNDLANLLSPFAILLGGVYYPVALLPVWLRIPARALPLGYGIQALSDAASRHAGIATLLPQLLPLAGFALVLPVAGVATFLWLERVVRERGELELY